MQNIECAYDEQHTTYRPRVDGIESCVATFPERSLATTNSIIFWVSGHVLLKQLKTLLGMFLAMQHIHTHDGVED